MAGFLRRKSKHSDAASPTKHHGAITQSQQPVVATPLFARFATLAQQHQQNGAASAGEQAGGNRVVSSPMSMTSSVRRENTAGGSSYRGYGASSVSIRSQSSTRQQARQSTGPPSSYQLDDRYAINRVSLDKPLPAPTGAPPSPTNSRRISSRGVASPASPSKLPARSRTSLIISDDKPLPIPGEQPRHQVRASPITGRKLSLQTSFQPTPQQPSGGRRSPTTTNLLDDEFDDVTPQALTPRPSQYRVGGAGAVGNGFGGGPAAGGIDLPPEFAPYQDFSTASSSPPGSSRIASPAARSTTVERKASAKHPQHSKAAINSHPAPLSSSTMGNSNSVLANGADSLYHSPLAPMATRPFMDGHSIPHLKAVDLNPRTSMRRVGYSPSPPPPPGASPPVLQSSPYVQEGHFQQQQQQPPAHTNPSTNYAPTMHVQTFSSPIMTGKPRIFAAMAALEADADSTTQPNHAALAYQPQPYDPSSGQPVFPEFQSNGRGSPHGQDYATSQRSMSISNTSTYYNHALLQPSQPTLSPPAANSSQLNAPMYYPDASAAPSTPPPVLPVNAMIAASHPRDSWRSESTARTPRSGLSRLLPSPSSSAKSLHRQSLPHPPPSSTPPHTPPRRKLSKARLGLSSGDNMSMMLSNGSAASIISIESMHSSGHGHSSNHGHGKVHQHNGHRTGKSHPPSHPPLPAATMNGSVSSLTAAVHVPSRLSTTSVYETPRAVVDEETMRNAGIPLDDDPFAKVEGVRMLSPIVGSGADDVSVATSSVLVPSLEVAVVNGVGMVVKRPKSIRAEEVAHAEVHGTSVPVAGVAKGGAAPAGSAAEATVAPKKSKSKAKEEAREERRRERRERKAREKLQKANDAAATTAIPTVSAAAGPTAGPSSSVAEDVEPEPEPIVGEELEALTGRNQAPFPLHRFVSHPQLLANLLSYFSFYDWCVLSSVTREIRIMLVQSPTLREEVFERYLRTVGYSRWAWEDTKEPLSLSLQDLADYMRGVSTPSHEYARVAKMYVHSLTMHPNIRDPSLENTVRSHTSSTRAYTRVVLRLRAQAEKEASLAASSTPSPRSMSTPPSASIRNGVTNGYANGYTNGYVNGYASRPPSRPPSRAPSPAMSNYSHSQAHGYAPSHYHGNTSVHQAHFVQMSMGFRSPLFRLKRAPLLRVFVPSPEGDWLSDKSVLECEAECKRAGVLHLMRMGDVVWDIAVGDEGNVGRLVYDGKYLIDLDYTFNPIGDLPKYIPTLAFPPSYFHRVIRTGAVTSNPVVHIDIGPWGEEIAANLQLLQDRVKTETPQGAYHNLVRWVNRSSFIIRPPARVMQRGPSINGRGQPHTPRIPIPETDNLFIDSGWYGTIVVETEGTKEALADLQDRCGPRAFPPRPRPLTPAQLKAQMEVRKVFRILREKSRPGEIWIKAVGVKERIL